MRTILMVTAVLALGLPAPGQAASIDKHAHQTFTVEPGALLRLQHGDGDVEITPWDRNEVDVDVVYRAKYTMVGVGKEPDFEVELRQEGPVIQVTGRETGVAMVGIFLSTEIEEYRYTIRAPKWLEVESRGEDGDVRIGGLRGDVRCRVEDGDVELADLDAERIAVTSEDGNVTLSGIRGALRIDIEDGDVEGEDVAATQASVSLEDGDLGLRRCSGEWDVRTADGRTVMREQAADTISIRADAGDVSVELVPGERANVEIHAADGDVELAVDPGVSTAFLLSSGDGGVRVDADGTRNLEQDGGRVYGEIGDAKGEIRASTDDGRISFRVGRGGA